MRQFNLFSCPNARNLLGIELAQLFTIFLPLFFSLSLTAQCFQANACGEVIPCTYCLEFNSDIYQQYLNNCNDCKTVWEFVSPSVQTESGSQSSNNYVGLAYLPGPGTYLATGKILDANGNVIFECPGQVIGSEEQCSGQEYICLTEPGPGSIGALPEGFFCNDPAPPGPYYIKVYANIVRKPDGSGGQSDVAINAAFETLRKDFAPYNIFFVRACGEFNILAPTNEKYEDPDFTSTLYDKPALLHYDGIDIFFGPDFVKPPTSAGGRANATGNAFYFYGTYRDANWINGAWQPLPVVLSRTVSHEMGHCLGLVHTNTFNSDPVTNSCCELVNGSNSSTCGDFVCDTDADPIHWRNGAAPNICDFVFYPTIPSFACYFPGGMGQPPHRDANGDIYTPPTSNLMTRQVRPQSCIDGFTEEQGKRMRIIIDMSPVLQACLVQSVQPDPIITTNTTWTANNGDVTIVGNLTVKDGATLTIEQGVTVRFGVNGSLIIQPGATVNLSGTLTSCSNEWKGVEVKHKFNSGATIPSRGLLVCLDGATISNALAGISFTHGAVTCNKTDFINNRIALQSTVKVLPGQAAGTLGYYGGNYELKQCDFIVDDAYSITQPFYAHVNFVSAVNQMTFSDCRFLNAMAQPPSVCYGINGAASFLRVRGKRTRFENLTYGVQTSINKRPPSVSQTLGAGYIDTRAQITDAVFDHCAVGIFDRTAIGNNYLRNKFYFGSISNSFKKLFVANHANPLIDPNFGAQIGITSESNVFGFSLIDNEFYGHVHPLNTTNGNPNVQTMVGTNMVNIGTNENIIFRNKFFQIDHANLALGANATVSGNTGLRYECNDMFDLNRNDIRATDHSYTIPGTNLGTIVTARLKRDQGRPNDPVGFAPAGNCFTDPLMLAAGYQSHFSYSNPAGLNYWYDANILCHEPEVGLLNVAPQPLFETFNDCSDIIVLGEGESNPPLGLNWTPEQTNANRQAWFEASAQAEVATGTSKDFLEAKANRLAELGYLAAIQEDQPFDSIAVWLERMGTYEAYLYLATLYANRADYTQALGVATTIPALFETANSTDLSRLTAIWTAMQLADGNDLNAETIQMLTGYADDEALYSSAVARSILEQAGIVHYAPILQLDSEVGERTEKTRATIEVKHLLATPNPADQLVTFTLDGVDAKSQSRLVVTDVYGKVVVSQKLNAPSFTWHTSNVAPGVYFARLLVDEDQRSEIKVLIQR